MRPNSKPFSRLPMNKYLFSALSIAAVLGLSTHSTQAQGWPANYDGVMLQGFSWDDYTNSAWTTMEANADEYSQYFSLIWVPQSGNCDGQSMGYNPKYYFDQNSSFGSESELRSMIKTFKQKQVGIIADVVINHRANKSNWVDFPAETYKGVTYQMVSTDIPYDDDGGACKTWADANGYQLSKNRDSGEGWGGMRDLDHASENVQKCIFAYEDFLLNDLGYTGFRYDVGKGFAAKYFGLYNSKANPQFSVGEVWDNNNVIKNWVKNTTTDGVIQSAAFDFQFRYAVRDMIASGYGSNSAPTFDNHAMLIADEAYRRYAVTFVENHDTQDRTATGGDKQDPIKVGGELKANAVLLGMPGTPCVFQPHWLAYKNDIKQMIEARKVAGIKSQSSWKKIACASSYYAWSCENLGAIVGKPSTTSIGSDFVLVQSVENNYYYFLKKACETPWVTLASGSFAIGSAQKVKLVAVSQTADAQLVYTTNGSAPSATNGTKVASNTEISIQQNTQLRVGLLVNGTVTKIIDRDYTFVEKEPESEEPAFEAPACCKMEEGEVCAFFETPASWTKTIKVWMWDNGGTKLNYTGGSWPGADAVKVGQTESGANVWKWSYTKTFNVTTPMIIFSNSGSPQTVDLDFVQGGYYREKGLVGVIAPASSIQEVHFDGAEDGVTYDNLGRRVSGTLSGRLYIRNGQKFILR